jgi:ABC-2 type transport system permease protein
VQAAGIVFIAAVFSRVPEINGWALPEVIVVFALMNLAGGVGSLGFEGLWYLPWKVVDGELDYYLVRPYPPALQVMSSATGLHGLGAIVTSVLLLGWAVPRSGIAWTPVTVGLALALVVSGILIKQATVLASASLVFWAPGNSFLVPLAVHEVGTLAQYPITIYSTGVQVMLSTVLPFAFVGFYPAAALMEPEHDRVAVLLGLCTPLVAALCVAFARTVFARGLRRYESAGH